MTKPTILLVEDTPSLARLYCQYLSKEPVEVVAVATGADALQELSRRAPEVVLLDLQLPDMNGMEILRHVRDQKLPSTVVIITAHGSINLAVEAMRGGAYDFIVKPFNADRLLVTVKNALERQKLTEIVDTLKDSARESYCGFIGRSLAMQAVYRMIDSAAASKATVFITGESGTGKEVCAEAIHEQGPRADKPFVAINCAAIPKDLMESEIFGHVRGAFTSAVSDRDGAASLADGGTLFLDEICEMDPALQTKLLRFVQTGNFRKVGSTTTEKVDVRFICATNRDPLAEVEAGRFREDLYYRLHVIPIHLPPLSERDDDVIEIANHFLRLYSEEEGKAFQRLAPETEALLRAYEWPGNVRQLQNVIRHVVVLNQGEVVTPDMLPPPLRNRPGDDATRAGHGGELAEPAPERQVAGPVVAAPNGMEIKPLWLVEKEAIERTIAACDGNVPKAAALLGISASTIYRKRVAWETREGR